MSYFFPVSKFRVNHFNQDLVRDYAYEHHRQDLMDILRAHKPDVHYSLIFQ